MEASGQGPASSSPASTISSTDESTVQTTSEPLAATTLPALQEPQAQPSTTASSTHIMNSETTTGPHPGIVITTAPNLLDPELAEVPMEMSVPAIPTVTITPATPMSPRSSPFRTGQFPQQEQTESSKRRRSKEEASSNTNSRRSSHPRPLLPAQHDGDQEDEEKAVGEANMDMEPMESKVVPLKRQEVWAWYLQNATYCAYGWVSATMLIPLLIQDIAAQGGVTNSDHSIPCDISNPNHKCVMLIFGDYYLDPGTISLYVSSLSAVVAFFISLSVAPIADHESYRKKFLLVFAFFGCVVSVAYFFVQSPKTFWLLAVLSPLGWAFYNASAAFSSSFLPIYVRAHPKVIEISEQLAIQSHITPMDERGTTNDLQALKEDTKCKNGDTDQVHLTATETDTIAAVGGATSGPVTLQQLRKTEEQVTNDLSAWCFGAANLGALVIQAACIGFSIGLASSPLRLQIAIAFTGVWWFVWTAVLMPWLDARPGPPMPKGRNWITYSWTKNWKTLKSIGQLSQISKFVLVWFILSDAVNTIISLLYVIAYQDLHFTHTKSVIMTLILSFTAFVGAYFFLWIRRIWALSTKFMFLLTVGLYIVSTAYFVIPTYFTVEFGLRQEWEAWAATVFVGFIVSTFYGAARVMLSELCPEGDENEWFSIFQLADKGSSWIGPLVTGVIQSVTGEFRIGFWFPLALFVFGGIVFITVDVDKGKDEAIRFKKEELAKHRLLASIPPITITPVPENSPPSSFPQDGRLTNI